MFAAAWITNGWRTRLPHEQPEENFRKVIETVAARRGDIVRVYSDFVCMAACALAMGAREAEYLELAKTYAKEDLEQFGRALGMLVEEMEADPFEDVLGRFYNEIASRFTRDMGGEFYTPKPVRDLMARVTVDVEANVAAGRPITVNEPASGSGGMILSLAECFARAKAVDLLRVTCQDVSKLACDMAYVNLTLWGVPARIVWGDTLRGTVRQTWRNIHWHRVGEHTRERIAHFMELLRTPPAADTGGAGSSQAPETSGTDTGSVTASIRKSTGGQQEWVFG